MRIYKYPIYMNGDCVVIPMRGPAKVVHIGDDPQSLMPTIWATADDSLPIENHKVLVVGTGHEMPTKPFEHIGSAICGIFVWHLFSDSLRQMK